MSTDDPDNPTANNPSPEGHSRGIVSTIGQDRPGLVSGITAMVTDMSLSIDDSRMSILGGEFAILMSVVGPKAALAELERKLRDYCQAEDMAFLFRHSSERAPISVVPLAVTVSAMDHPGIVRSVAAFFSEQGINILELSTETEPAPHTGTPIFSLHMTVELPTSKDSGALERAFEEFCFEQDLDGEIAAEG